METKNKLIIIGKILLSTVGVALLFGIFAGGGSFIQSNASKILGNFVIMLFPIAVFFYVKFLNRKLVELQPSEYGFTFQRFINNFLIGIFIASGIMLFVIFLAYIVLAAKIEFLPLKENYSKSILGMLATLLIVGVWEEFFFRGFVFTYLLKSKFNFHLAAIISSILFSAVHWTSFDMNITSPFWYIGIVFLGYILALLYALTKSIWTVVGFHFFWNMWNQFIDDKANQIGIFQISNYSTLHSKSIDNIEIFILGIVLIFLIILQNRKIKKAELSIL